MAHKMNSTHNYAQTAMEPELDAAIGTTIHANYISVCQDDILLTLSAARDGCGMDRVGQRWPTVIAWRILHLSTRCSKNDSVFAE
jgi:hypothetical protein